MKRLHNGKWLFVTLLTLEFGWSGPGFNFGGYAENVTGIYNDSNYTFTNAASLRSELSWEFDRGALEVHAILSNSMQPLDLFFAFRPESKMTFLAGSLVQPFQIPVDSVSDSLNAPAFDPQTIFQLLPYSSLYPSDNLALDRAVIQLYFKHLDVYIGRQMIGWGTGYAFNPTDIWNQKNPADPSAPKLGVNAIRLEIPFGAVSGLSVVTSPGVNADLSTYGLRARTNFWNYDFSVSLIRQMNADRALFSLPRRYIGGFDLAGEIFGGAGVWLETAGVNPVPKGDELSNFDSAYVQLTAGMDYTLENGLHMMAEYYHNGLGKTSADDYTPLDLIRLFGGESSGLARHYIFIGVDRSFAAFWQGSLFGLVNAVDGSVTVIPSVEYGFSDNIFLTMRAQIGIGESESTEYGSAYPAVFLETKAFF